MTGSSIFNFVSLLTIIKSFTDVLVDIAIIFVAYKTLEP